MPPRLVLITWLILLLALFRWDGEKKTSLALWVPVLWFSVVGSRLPSQWLGGGGDAAEMMAEGNGFDRLIYIALILLALAILNSRGFAWSRFFLANRTLASILLFSLVSILWSDFPFIAFKRWFRDLGTYLAILVAVTDAGGVDSVRALLRRVCYVLIPLSIVLIKYFPEMGKQYSEWTGQAFFNGVATSKNMLGVLCLVSGLYFFWDTVTRWSHRDNPMRRRIILINVSFIAMTLWLLSMASSATSSLCLVLGALIITLAHTKTIKQRPALLTGSIPIGISIYLLLQFVLDVDLLAALAVAVGRDPDLTGRTKIWSVVLALVTNPLIGTGYESFWLGERLQRVWQQAGPINEAHNGFLEVYLSLGLIGLVLYCLFLIASYRSIARNINASSMGSLNLALWTILVFYNVTESALRGHLMWVAFLLGTIALSVRTSAPESARSRGRRQPRHVGAART